MSDISQNLVKKLIQSFTILPGIGPKSAQRIVFHLLQHNPIGAELLGKTLLETIQKIKHCQYCNTFSEHITCNICQDSNRDFTILCIVETPMDQLMIEQTMIYHGLYFVLMGRLSPLDGIGPKNLSLSKLLERLNRNDSKITEVILATNLTSEGEITAHYISNLLKKNKNIKISRIAQGIPIGSELEYTDPSAITKAIADRILLK